MSNYERKRIERSMAADKLALRVKLLVHMLDEYHVDDMYDATARTLSEAKEAVEDYDAANKAVRNAI